MTLEEIKQYNKELREYKKKFETTKAKMELAKDETNRLCMELSEELGYEVTANNIEQVYAEHQKKLQDTLEMGREILDRIKGEQ